jgi:hypothetical protein
VQLSPDVRPGSSCSQHVGIRLIEGGKRQPWELGAQLVCDASPLIGAASALSRQAVPVDADHDDEMTDDRDDAAVLIHLHVGGADLLVDFRA